VRRPFKWSVINNRTGIRRLLKIKCWKTRRQPLAIEYARAFYSTSGKAGQKRQMADRKKKKPAVLIEELSISILHINEQRTASIKDALRMGSFTREYEMMQLDQSTIR
jgi:hypothetical protein